MTKDYTDFKYFISKHIFQDDEAKRSFLNWISREVLNDSYFKFSEDERKELEKNILSDVILQEC